MIARLSTRGRLVIPKQIRNALGLRPGMYLNIHIEGNEIVLEPISGDSSIEALYGHYAGKEFLTTLETEHQEELKADASD